MFDYFAEYEKSKDTEKFWEEKGKQLHWDKEFTKVYGGKFSQDKWYYDGELNACYNCVDRHVKTNPDKIAIIFNDNNNETFQYTFKELLKNIIRVANVISKYVKKGDCVTLYMGMSPEVVFAMLACARLGVTHNIVFGGYSIASLKMRIEDSKSNFIITTDVCNRGDKRIRFIDTVSAAAGDLPILVLNKNEPEGVKNAIYYSSLEKNDEFVECVSVNAEHPLFYLYTSGSTGKPKGLVHTTGGYLAYSRYTTLAAFNIRPEDIFCCTADIGWITGHTYCVYGPLSLGITTVLLEGLPNYPTPKRFFEIVQQYKITQLYTAPTTIRILKKYFETNNDMEAFGVKTSIDLPSIFDLSSLRLLGSVGEPINKEAHSWFSKSFGNVHIVDCYWQTETGGVVIASFSNAKPCKPECAGMPMPGIFPMIGDGEKDAKTNELGKVFITKSWPGIARSIINDPERYSSAYFEKPCYFSGDEGIIDEDGDIWIRGRADDVINVCGHRISTAEVESAACTNPLVAEAAVVAVNHEIKGSCILLFVLPKSEDYTAENLSKSVMATITEKIGGIARPEKVIGVVGIPKTATGKIIRRVLRNIVNNEDMGDLSTCVNKEVIESIRNAYLNTLIN